MRNLSAPQTRLCAASCGRSDAPRRIVAPSPRPRPRCSATSTRRSRALAGVARPVHPGLDRRGPAGARRRRSRTSRQQRPFLANSEALFRELQPGRATRSRTPRRRWPTRSTVGHPDAASARSPSTSRLEPLFKALRDASPSDPLVDRSASSDLTETANVLEPDARLPHAGPDGLQLHRRCSSATPRACSARATRNGTWQRFIDHRHAAGPATTRAARPPRRPTAACRRRTTTCTPTRTRTPPRRASRDECEAGNERFIVGQAGHRQRARQPGAPRRDDDDEALMARPPRTATPPTRPAQGPHGREPVRGRRGRARRARRRRVLRLHQAHPVHARLPRQGGLPSRPTRSAPNSPVRIAGVNVGKVVKDRAQGRHQRRRRDDGDRRQGPADPQGRHAEDPPAHLPRGQLLRRPQAGHARLRRRSTTATRSRSPRRRRRCSSTRC